MKKQLLIRIYPHGWTNTAKDINTLNNYLSSGWRVIMCTNLKTDKVETTDYIIESEVQDESN